MSQPTTPRAGPTRHDRNANPRTRLLAQSGADGLTEQAGGHGTFTLRSVAATPVTGSPSLGPSQFGGLRGRTVTADGGEGSIDSRQGVWPLNKSSTTTFLAEQHGVKNPRLNYWMYYIPCLHWMKDYKSSYLLGDTIAGSRFLFPFHEWSSFGWVCEFWSWD